MNDQTLTLLVIGATGSVGGYVVDEALRRGHKVRAMQRRPSRAALLPPGVEIAIGDITKPVSLKEAAGGVDAIILTVNADGQGKAAAEAVYYTGVRNVLTAIAGRAVRIGLMTTIGVTERAGHYNRTNEGHDWKRRAERLVRASGHSYTIVRPGWFDYNDDHKQRIVMLQGDRRRSGTPADGAIGRRQIARVLVESLTSPEADHKTLELIADQGSEQADLTSLFQMLDPDPAGALDAVHDLDNMPLSEEPARVRDDLILAARDR